MSGLDTILDWLEPAKLETALLYPGSGSDLQPITLFSHLVKRFIFVDPGVGRELRRPDCVIQEVGAKIDETPGLVFSGYRVAESGMVDERARAPLFAVRFDLAREIGRRKRRVELLYVNADVFRLFDWLWVPRRAVPAILAEIQLNKLVGGPPDQRYAWESEFADRFERIDRYPLLWALGGMQAGQFCDYEVRHGLVEGRRRRPPQPALPGERDAHWARRAPRGTPPNVIQRVPRRVSVHDRTDWRIVVRSSDSSWLPLRREVGLRRAKRVATLVRDAPPSLLDTEFEAMVTLEDGMTFRVDRQGLPVERFSCPSSEAFEALLQKVEGMSHQAVAAVPAGRPDEWGERLLQWVRKREPAPQLTLFLEHELDFADLRGWHDPGRLWRPNVHASRFYDPWGEDVIDP
jgi:hypothetical protein